MITINGTNYTKYCMYPKSTQKTLDESLNQGVLVFKNLTLSEPFEPLSEVSIDGNEWLVAVDSVDQTRFGASPLYKHDLTLIEKAKELERYFVDSCTFRNPLVKLYLDSPINAPYRNLQVNEIKALFEEAFGYSTFLQTPTLDNTLMSINSSLIKTPKAIGTDYTSTQFNSITGLNSGSSALFGFNTGFILKNPNGEIIDSEVKYNTVNTTTVSFANATKGNYSLYCLVDKWSNQTSPHTSLVQGICFTITVINDLDELSDWTITDVVNRLLAITETQRYGDTPRFNFNSTQATKYSTVLAPEFNFTKGNLFEALKQIGGYIHAIPELNGTEISFKELGQREYATIPENHVAYSSTQSIDQFCSEIDTNVNNLVNLDDSKSGSIIEPYADGLKTTRTETGTAIITDDNCHFETTMPIESIDSLEIGYLSDNEYIGDATKYVFEKSEYDALSSYSGEYPWSKAYALYFKQGTRNIYGLQFEENDAVSPIFKQPAIINIVEAITGNSYSTLFNTESIMKLQYRIKYKPLINARLKQRKSYIGATNKKSILAYNQSANKVDTDYYGENLKGMVERLGNIEKAYTYVVSKESETPQVGQIFNKDYYISVVKEEEYGSFRKYTLGLSKDFNRLNEYVGVDNNKRYYEVDERATIDRFVVYEDYLVVSDDFDMEEAEHDKSICTIIMAVILRQNFITPSSIDFYTTNNITCMNIMTYDKDMQEISNVVLPAITSHLGNSAFYQIQFEDNFGVGNKIEYMLTDHKGTQSQIEYGDDYGRAEYLGIEGLNNPFIYGTVNNYATAVNYGMLIPDINNEYTNGLFESTTYTLDGNDWIPTRTPIILKKDSAERIIFAYQIHCVTDKENVIIGSGLPKKLGTKPITYNEAEHVDCYIMDREIGKFESIINDLPATAVSYTIESAYSTTDIANKQLTFSSITANTDGKSIVMVDRTTKELIYAINQDIVSGQAYQLPKMCFRHKIF